MAVRSEGLAEALQTFQLTWGLDDKCIDYVGCLPESVQSEVIRQFEHGPEQTNPSARCTSFAKKLMQERSGTESLPQFQAKWGIDDQCVEFLASLPQHVLGTVIANFYQKPEQTNVSARCQAFAQSVLRRQGGGGAPAALPAAQPALIAPQLIRPVTMLRTATEPRFVPPPAKRQSDPLRPLQLFAPAPAAVTRLGPPARSVPPGGEDATDALGGGDDDDLVSRLLEFQSTWSLDDACTDFLGSLPASVQTKLVSEFTHRPDQTNPSARCMAFAKKLMQTQPADEDDGSAISAFQAKWGVDDACAAYLASMPSHIQAIVLNNFEHKPGQTNVSARCQAYARSVMLRSAAGAAGASAGASRQAPLVAPQAARDASASLLAAAARVVVPSLAAKRPAEAASYASLLAAAARVIVPALAAKRPAEALIKPVARAPRVVPAIVPAATAVPAALGAPSEPLDLAQFQATWGLDDRCIEHLSSLPPQVQSIVVAKFEHRPDQTNPSARCQAFAQSVLRGQQGSSVLQDFQAKWGVDDRCMELLASMPPHVQAIVTSGFEHRPDQTNVSARCMAYARSVHLRSPHALPPLKAPRLA